MGDDELVDGAEDQAKHEHGDHDEDADSGRMIFQAAAATTLVSAIIEPIERSISPAIMITA